MKISNIKDLWWLFTTIAGLLGVIIGGVWSFSIKYSDFNHKNDELVETIKTTQQMALKSVIWNDEIPLAERASACDVYLANGYNSLTKKECEVIIEESAEKGTFSYGS